MSYFRKYFNSVWRQSCIRDCLCKLYFRSKSCCSNLTFSCRSDGEAIVPHQVTLLKLLDAYLQNHSELRNLTSSDDRLVQMLVPSFLSLTVYVQDAIQRALGPDIHNAPLGVPITDSPSDSTDLPQELDFSIPKVCEALVLVTQCLISLGLAEAEDAPSGWKGPATTYMIEAATTIRQGMVEALVGGYKVDCVDCFIILSYYRNTTSPRYFYSADYFWQNGAKTGSDC